MSANSIENQLEEQREDEFEEFQEWKQKKLREKGILPTVFH
jgi:hypothetical protein